MNSQPLITVAIPAYNHEAFVEQALDSVIQSGLSNLEIIICDDNSSDTTPAIIHRWKELHSRNLARFVFIEHKRNTGTGVALNEIIAEARGEIIHGLASDDYYLPGGLRAKTELMLANPSWEGAFCDGQAVGYNREIYCESLISASTLNTKLLTGPHLAEELLYNWQEPANLLSWRRRVFKIHGGSFEYDPTIFCEDFDFALWAMSSNALGFVPDTCYAYRCRSWPQSSNRNRIREHRDMSYVLAKNAQRFPLSLQPVMRNLSAAIGYTATGDDNLAIECWKIHQDYKEKYLQGIASPAPRDDAPVNVPLPADYKEKYPQDIATPTPVDAPVNVPLPEVVPASPRSVNNKIKDALIAEQKQKIKGLENSLRYHRSNPLRALKLWWNHR